MRCPSCRLWLASAFPPATEINMPPSSHISLSLFSTQNIENKLHACICDSKLQLGGYAVHTFGTASVDIGTLTLQLLYFKAHFTKQISYIIHSCGLGNANMQKPCAKPVVAQFGSTENIHIKTYDALRPLFVASGCKHVYSKQIGCMCRST